MQLYKVTTVKYYVFYTEPQTHSMTARRNILFAQIVSCERCRTRKQKANERNTEFLYFEMKWYSKTIKIKKIYFHFVFYTG